MQDMTTALKWLQAKTAWQREENVGRDVVCYRQSLHLVEREVFHWSTVKMIGFTPLHQETFPKVSEHSSSTRNQLVS